MKLIMVLASLLITSIAMACPPESMCKGDRIIDGAGNTGTVKKVFEDGRASVVLDGYIFGAVVRKINEIGKGVACDQNICVNDRVSDSSGYTGTVKEVFDNGEARVLFDGYIVVANRNVIDLGKSFRCIESVCINDKLPDGSNSKITIKELFDNGKARVALEGYLFQTVTRSFSSLGIELKCNLRENCARRN